MKGQNKISKEKQETHPIDRTSKQRGQQFAVIGILLLILLIGGLMSRSHGGLPKGIKSLDMGQVKQQAIEAEKARAEAAKYDLKAEMDRNYGDNLYFEDLKETEERLLKEMAEEIEKGLESKFGGTFIAKPHIKFYRDTLKKARDENLHITDFSYMVDDVFDPEVEPYDKGLLWVYGFLDGPIPFEVEKNLSNTIHIYSNGVEDCFYIYPSSVLNIYKEDVIRDMAFPLIRLQQVSDYMYSTVMSFWSDKDGTGKDITERTEKMLNEKYGGQFVMIHSSGFGGSVGINLNDPEYPFVAQDALDEYPNISDMHLLTQVQKRMSTYINEQIDAMGLGDDVVQYTAVDNNLLYADNYHMKKSPDGKPYMEDYYTSFYETVIVYLLEPGEIADFEKIQKLVKAIIQNSKQNPKRTIHITFYTAKPEDKAVLKSLFREDLAPDFYDRGDNLSQQLTSLENIRSNTEGFKYLDVYCTRTSLFGKMYDNADLEMDIEQFKDAYFEER